MISDDFPFPLPVSPVFDPASERIVLRVAGYRFSVCGAGAIGTLRTLGGFAPFTQPGSRDDEDELFAFDYSASRRTGDAHECMKNTVHRFQTEGIDCAFSRTKNGYAFSMTHPGERPFIWDYSPGEKRCAAHGPIDAAVLRFSLWQALGTALLPHATVAVHSSAICAKEKAVLFLGESGTGKSTHTKLWRQHIPNTTLLNDDSPFLQIAPDGKAYVWGSPWSGKTPCYRDLRYPVAAIVRLSQAPHNRIRRLSTVEAIGALLPSLPPSFAYERQTEDRILDIISRTLATVPVFHLECLPDADAARLSYRSIFDVRENL